MSTTNLTRAEAAERANLVVDRYTIELDVTRSAERFGTVTTVRFAARAGQSTFIDALLPTVHAVELNGRALDPAAVHDGARIRLDDLAEQNELRVVGEGVYSSSFEGMQRFVDPADGAAYLFTHFEAAESRRVFAVFEQPDLKASFEVSVTAPADWIVVSTSPSPEPTLETGEARIWHFSPTARIASYVVEIAAGPWVEAPQSAPAGGIPISIYARASVAPDVDADALAATLTRGIAFYEALFGQPYPYAKCDLIMAPGFSGGAMENVAAILFSDSFAFRSREPQAAYEVRDMVLLHELSHMWFGNLVTMRWWDELWLKESFAVWAAYRANAESAGWTDSWVAFATAEKTSAYVADQRPSTHPISADVPDLEAAQFAFDGIAYAKGAAVMRQLVAWVGEDAFDAGLRTYIGRHTGGNTVLADLLAALEEASGRDLHAWSRAWLETSGVDTLRMHIETVSGGTIASAVLERSAPGAVSRPHRLAIGLYENRGGVLELADRLSVDVTAARTPVPALVGRVRPAVLLPNDDDAAYAKIRLDPASEAAALVTPFTDARARAAFWVSLWDRTRDGELPAHVARHWAIAALESETVPALRSVLLDAAATAARELSGRADAALRQTADAIAAALGRCEAGSDAQLELATALASVGEHLTDPTTLRGLFDGTQVPAGLVVSTDLRWGLLVALAAAGLTGETEIDARAAADRSSLGEEHAARARAALATSAAKSAAWEHLVTTSELESRLRSASAHGFWRARDRALLEPFAERYPAELARIAAAHPPSAAQSLARALFPVAAGNARTLAAVDDWLAGDQGDAVLRRVVLDRRDDLVRTLRARRAEAEERVGE